METEVNYFPQNNAKRIGITSLVVFSLFSFSWLAFFQGYLICYAYDTVISSIGGIAGNCNRFIMAVCVTAILDLMAVYIRRLKKKPSVFSSLDFLVPSLILGIFTGFDNESYFSQTTGQWVAASILTVFVLSVVAIIRHRNIIKPEKRMIVFTTNLLLLFLEMLIVALLGNTDENLHRRAAMEKYIGKSQFEKVLEVGYNEDETDTKIEWLRLQAMYSLDTLTLGSGLAERLFEYPVSDFESAETFLVNSVSSSDDSLMQVYLNNVIALLKCDMQSFGDSAVTLQYDKELPKFFMQALILAGHDSLDFYYPEQYRQEKQVFDSFESTLKEVGHKPDAYRRNATYWDFRRTYYWYYRFGQL